MPSNGRVIPHTPLAVDFWQVRKCPGTRLFFLSHMHSDHTVGLTSTWSNRPIYCSPLTATLLRLKLQVKDQWIHPLEVGGPHLLPLDDIGKERLTVTLMDANHCPGSVMFLFQGYFGSILYTGDFRYTPTMLRELCMPTNAIIDVLYLDNTNCDPNRSLPSRQQATQQIKEIIRSHPDHDVVIGLYSLGKESLLVELAMEFKTWIEVSHERMETLKVLELPDVFTTDPGAGRIRAVEQTEISSSAMHHWNNEQPTLAILPTSRPLVSFHSKVHVVPYSDHSSYQELEDFVTALRPTSLLPIVGNFISGSLSALLANKKRHEILVPESVRHYMLNQPKSQPASSFTGLRRRHVQPLIPKGVVFESPMNTAAVAWECILDERQGQDVSGEDTETESSDQGSDCIFIDLSKRITPNYHKRQMVSPCRLKLVKTVPEEMLMPESVPFSQLSQSNFAPVTILENTSVHLRPVKILGCKTSQKMVVADGKNSEPGRLGIMQKSPTFSQIDDMSQCHGPGMDVDADVSDDDTTPHQQQQDQCNCNMATLLQTSPDDSSVLNTSSKIPQAHVKEIENSILKHLPFEKEDFQKWRLLDKSIGFVIGPSKDNEL